MFLLVDVRYIRIVVFFFRCYSSVRVVVFRAVGVFFIVLYQQELLELA